MRLVIANGVAGRGAFARESVDAGTELIQFAGPLLKYKDTSPTTLAVQIGPDLYMGASGGPDDFVNHCCEPNAGLIVRDNDVRLIAIRDIDAGEEIFFDYSTTMDEDDFEMKCRCGKSTCRGTVRDFKHLPEPLKRRYANLGIVPEYNLKYVSN